jgi:hypothetical protein
MRRTFILGVICILMMVSLLARADESYIIRRAYIDVLGIVPTVEEIEWYCVYNSTSSYKTAVEWIINHPNYKWDETIGDARTYLHSDLYKSLKKMPIAKKRMNEIIIYVAGDKHEATEENVNKSIVKIVKQAIQATDSDLDAVDYITNRLMSRVTNKEEANYLMSFLREKKKTLSEENAWKELFKEILSLEDVRCR